MKQFFKPDTTVLFQGDSVTDCGRNRDKSATSDDIYGDGYPFKFKQMYDVLFENNGVKFVNRGISGNRVRDLLTRYDEDFKAEKPDFISIMIGINDTWRGFDSDDITTAERFEAEYEELLTKIKADMPDAKILIIEQFAFIENPARADWSPDLDPKRAVTRKLADKYADWFIPMYDILTEAAKNDFDMYDLSADGVHPAPTGHAVIASEIMKTLGII